jgi:hypothetical protein
MIDEMLDGLGNKGIEAALSGVDVAEIPQVRGFVMMLAGVEQQNIAATDHLLDSLDAETDVDVPDVEERQEQLLDVFSAAMSQQLDQWWLENVAAERMDNVEQASDLLGIGPESEAWEQQKRAWKEYHVEQGTADQDTTTEAVAQRHVQAVFGVSMDHFEAEILAWDEQEELQKLLVGPLQSNAATVERLADHLDGGDDQSEGGE